MMRRLIPAAAAALLLVAWQAQAQTQTQTAPATTGQPAVTAPAAPSTATPAPKPASHHRTLQQRFDAANTTHDGHLTKDQATAANWPFVANNFAAIDKDKKGYVTVKDIRAYAKARRAAHQTQKPAPATTQPAAPNNG
jgi:transposase